MTSVCDTASVASRRDDRFRSQFRKTEMCKFFQRNGCSNGSSCKFAHGEGELQVAPDLTKTSLCRAWKERRCTRSSQQCPFAHGPRELRPTAAYSSPKKHAASSPVSTPNGASAPAALPVVEEEWASSHCVVPLEAAVPQPAPVLPPPTWMPTCVVPACVVPYEGKTTAPAPVLPAKAVACGATCEAGERRPAEAPCLRLLSDVVAWSGVGSGRDLEALLRMSMPESYED